MPTPILLQIHRFHVRIDRLINRFPACPQPVSCRVDQHLSQAEQLEAAWWAWTVTEGACC